MPQLFFNEDISSPSSDISNVDILTETEDCSKSPVNPREDPQTQDHGITNGSPGEQFGKIRKNGGNSCNSINVYRRARTAFNAMQLYHLEQEFLLDPYISRSKRKTLAELLQLPEITIKVWFQNRRMKDKRARLNIQWQMNTAPAAAVYGNTVVRNPPMYASYPLQTLTAPPHGAYPPVPFYGYSDIPPISHGSYGYPFCTNSQTNMMSDMQGCTYNSSLSPPFLESGTVPASLGTTYRSPSVIPLSAYYHSYPICNTCTGSEPLNLDVKGFRTVDKREVGEIENSKMNRVKPSLFRPFDE